MLLPVSYHTAKLTFCTNSLASFAQALGRVDPKQYDVSYLESLGIGDPVVVHVHIVSCNLQLLYPLHLVEVPYSSSS